jgi:predicted enzyme related to lactoylglutathione lyase
MANPVVYFEVIGKEGAKLRDFYGRLFDWKFEEAPGMDYGMLSSAGDGGIGGGIGIGPPGAPSYVTVYVQVDDINAYLRKAETLGAKTVTPRTVIPNTVTFAQLTDPEGHLIGLVEGPSGS